MSEVLWKVLGVVIFLACCAAVPFGVSALFFIFCGTVDENGQFHTHWKAAAGQKGEKGK